MPPLFFYCWDIAFWDGGDLVSLIGLHVMFGRAPSGN